MKRSKKAKAARASRKVGGRMAGPPPSAVRYSGPVKLSETVQDVVAVTFGTALPVQISANGSGDGTINTVVNTVDVFSLGSFTNMSNLYDEYRVLGIRCEFIPKLQNASVLEANSGSGSFTAYCSPMFLAPWREDGTPIGSVGAAMITGDVVVGSINTRLTKEIRADEIDEMEWRNSTASIPTGQQYGVKIYAELVSAVPSLLYQLGSVLVYWAVQFRTRRAAGWAAMEQKQHPAVETKQAAELPAVPMPTGAAAAVSRSGDWMLVRRVPATPAPRQQNAAGVG